MFTTKSSRISTGTSFVSESVTMQKKSSYFFFNHTDFNFRLLLSYGGIYPNILKFYYDFFTPKNDMSKLFEVCSINSLSAMSNSNNIGIFLQSAQVYYIKIILIKSIS